MNISGINNVSLSAEVQRDYQTRPYAAAQVRKENDIPARRFDSVSIDTDRRGSFELELRGKIKQEVRAATSSGQVAALTEQVRGGAYQPDPAAIARKLLLMGTAV